MIRNEVNIIATNNQAKCRGRVVMQEGEGRGLLVVVAEVGHVYLR